MNPETHTVHVTLPARSIHRVAARIARLLRRCILPHIYKDFVGDEDGPRYRLRREDSPQFPPGSPLHNPYGQWRLKPLKS